jgi:hypothetical protein
VLLVLVSAAAPALAQAPPAPAAPPPPPAVQWQRTASVQGSFASAPFVQTGLDPSIPALTGAALGLPGRQITVQSSVAVGRITSRNALQITGGITYLNTQPTGTLAKTFAADVEYRHVVSPRVYWLSRTSERRDTVRNIDNAFVETLGVGYTVTQSPRFRMDVTPGAMMQHENNNTRFDGDWLFSLGGMVAAQGRFSQTAGFEARMLARRSVQHSEVWAVESSAGVQAALTQRLALTATLTYNYDNLLGESFKSVPANQLFPGSPALQLFATHKRQVQFATGLQVTF